MVQIVENVRWSFDLAKRDIQSLYAWIQYLDSTQKALLSIIEDQQQQIKELTLNPPVQKVIRQEVVKHILDAPTQEPELYVGTKSGKIYHISDCPYAKNIKPQNHVTLKPQERKQRRACSCVA